MAQTKRKRRTKHRGTAAGTGHRRAAGPAKPPSADEVKKQKRTDAQLTRLTSQPTWRRRALRAGLAAVFICIFLLVTTTATSASR